MKIIDLDNWNRKEHFAFFSKYDNPFSGIVTEIDCTTTYEKSKASDLSFFASYLHKSIQAVNQIEEMKLRVVDNQVVMYDEIHAASTIGRADGTFGFSFMNFAADFDIFNAQLKSEIQSVQNSNGLHLNENGNRVDVVHYSIFPWNKFTGITHARNFNTDDTVPKIAFGKAFRKEDRWMMPISIEAHHGLVDGLHISKFLEAFQVLLNE